MNQTPQTVRIANKLRELRTQAGQTQADTARSAGISITAYRGWEAGTMRPTLERAPGLARALGCPIAALFEPFAVTEVVLSPQAVARVRAEGLPAAVELTALVTAQLPQLILNTAKPKRSPSGRQANRGKPRRTRAEVLAGIQAANRMRAERQAAGPPQGQTPTSSGGLPSASAEVRGVGGLSTLSAEDGDLPGV